MRAQGHGLSAIRNNGCVTCEQPVEPEALRLMAVHAHPDDESSKGAATMARYVDEGVEVLVVTCTGGERGSILNPALQDRPEIEAEHRRDPSRRDGSGPGDPRRRSRAGSGFVDSGLPEGDPLPPLPEGCFALTPIDEGAGRLVAEIRRFRPHVITTYDENGGYPHPDHIRTHEISVAAFDAAADPEAFPDDRRAVAAAEAVLRRRVQRREDQGAARRDARPGARVAVRGVAGAPRHSGPTAARRTSPPGSRSPTGSSAATPRCSPTRPRWTRTDGSSRSRSTCSARSGPPRTSNSSGRSSIHQCPRTICSRECARRSARDACSALTVAGRREQEVRPDRAGRDPAALHCLLFPVQVDVAPHAQGP